jgi:hypothetical protein
MNPSPADSGSSLSEAETRHSRQPLHPSTTTTNIPSTDISNSNKRIEPNRSGPDINKALLLTEDIRRGEKLLGESFSTLKLSVPGPNPFPTTMPTPMPDQTPFPLDYSHPGLAPPNLLQAVCRTMNYHCPTPCQSQFVFKLAPSKSPTSPQLAGSEKL